MKFINRENRALPCGVFLQAGRAPWRRKRVSELCEGWGARGGVPSSARSLEKGT